MLNHVERIYVFRLTPTMKDKPIFASPFALCITKSISNRRGKGVGILHCEERGEVKMDSLSPARQIWRLCNRNVISVGDSTKCLTSSTLFMRGNHLFASKLPSLVGVGLS